MRGHSTLRKIEKEVEKLPPRERLKLVERLVHGLRKTGMIREKKLDWGKLYGIGKGLWKGVDAQEYVNRLRDERT